MLALQSCIIFDALLHFDLDLDLDRRTLKLCSPSSHPGRRCRCHRQMSRRFISGASVRAHPTVPPTSSSFITLCHMLVGDIGLFFMVAPIRSNEVARRLHSLVLEIQIAPRLSFHALHVEKPANQRAPFPHVHSHSILAASFLSI